ncbi:MAG: BrnT family toxin [Magnetococcales bacterium]|nr:BrnT family toxin [Magnetococcales bacterium]MBF0113944.1 BrnT family toxin [Magnetococcales bacterium]
MHAPTPEKQKPRCSEVEENANLGISWLYKSTVVDTINSTEITYDPNKRAKTLEERGLDFKESSAVFAGYTYELEDTRHDYGERRIMCFGTLNGRMVVVGYVQRDNARHIFSMRKANEREIARYSSRLA